MGKTYKDQRAWDRKQSGAKKRLSIDSERRPRLNDLQEALNTEVDLDVYDELALEYELESDQL